MSRPDYQASNLAATQFGFHALLMAAMRNADSTNAADLRAAFPQVWTELQARYHAPGGILPGDAKPVSAEEVALDHPDLRHVELGGSA